MQTKIYSEPVMPGASKVGVGGVALAFSESLAYYALPVIFFQLFPKVTISKIITILRYILYRV